MRRGYVGLGVMAIAGMSLLAACQLREPTPIQDLPELVDIAPRASLVLPAGEYLLDGYVQSPTAVNFTPTQRLQIMKRNVSQTEYQQCVDEKSCQPIALTRQPAKNMPMVGVSWRDAQDYAEWFSARTGMNFRLPTYIEWSYITGLSNGKPIAEALLETPDTRAEAWLIEYKESYERKKTSQPVAQVFGTYGENEQGLIDVAANVWDWTDTCHVREHRQSGSDAVVELSNCGVRVAAGAHTAYMSDFIRDPKSGACSVGVPPANLGIRLLLDSSH